MGFVFKHVKIILVAVLHQVSQVLLGFRKFSINAAHSLYGSKVHRPTVYLIQYPPQGLSSLKAPPETDGVIPR